jgi:lysyl-tRNA synthetase class 2
MQIESLWQYNDKYDPEWHPRYGVYDAVQNIVPIAVAVMRAEQFTEFPLLGRFLKPPAAVSGS